MNLDALNVRTFFEDAAARTPDEPFLIWAPDGTETSFAQANERIDRAANVWHSLGVRKGDRVAFMLDNSPDFLFAWLGLAKLGGILVAINTGFRTAEARYLVTHSDAHLALVGAEYMPIFSEIQASVGSLTKVLTVGEHPGSESFAELSEVAEAVAPPVPLHGDDVISLIYTSGTTGNPKGVMQTHRNFVLTGQAYPYWMRMEPGQRIYACLPMFHINTQSYSIMGAIGVGGAVVLSPRFSASQFWPEVRRHRVNVFNFIGAMTVILSKKEPAPDDADNEVHTAYGVPALAPEIRGDIERRFGLKVISGFGMSETTYGLLEPIDNRRPGTMGFPRHHPDPTVPRTEARIGDAKGRELPRGQVGELLLRNAAMMTGYFRDPERTTESLVDGWLYTGDSAYQDEDDYFYFVDRKKDIVRRRGENVSSLEVERVIERHPSVFEAAVIGVPSELTDEELLAYVVRASGGSAVAAEEIFDWCAEQLAPFKVPRYLEFVDSLPKTPTSKIQKAKLRERSAADSGARIERRASSRPRR